jgi:hypothetical protein
MRMLDLLRLSNAIEADLASQHVQYTVRNRNAKRRKPNAFHWIDENWTVIAPIFDTCVAAGMISRGRH